nr:VWA domain-containing protein [Variovorax sp. dw_954]
MTPRHAGLCTGSDNTLDVLVRIQAPDAPANEGGQRPPHAIGLVLDKSGSMNGQPLVEALRCAEFVVSQLRPTDVASVVSFDNRVERLWPAVPIGNGAGVRGAIGRIQPGGNTNLHGGWLEGANTLADAPNGALQRVILLSDGCANEGLIDSAEISAQCAAWAAKGVTTSTYGLGRNFNEDLMVAMARAGNGNHYYGDTAEDLMEPFQQELDLLANLALREVTLSATPFQQISLTLLNDLQKSASGWRLPDLAWGAEAWAMLQVVIPAGALPPPGKPLLILEVGVSGVSLEGVPVTLEPARLELMVLPDAAFGALAEDELVRRRSDELAASHMLTQMRAAAMDRRWDEVDRLLAEAQECFKRSEWVGSILSAMSAIARSRSRDRMMKEARYSSMKLNSRLASKDETGSPMNLEDLPAYLRRKPLQGKRDL